MPAFPYIILCLLSTISFPSLFADTLGSASVNQQVAGEEHPQTHSRVCRALCSPHCVTADSDPEDQLEDALGTKRKPNKQIKSTCYQTLPLDVEKDQLSQPSIT